MFYGYWENTWPFNRHLYKWDPCLHSIIYFQIIKSAIQMPYDSLTKKRENPCGLRCQEKKFPFLGEGRRQKGLLG